MIFVNLKGRQPRGTVEPGKQYEELRDKIIESLSKVVNAETLKPAHVAAGLTIPILLAICGVLVAIDPWFLLYALGAAFVLAILSGIFALQQTRSWRVALNMPVALTIFLIAWSCGFLRELIMPTWEFKH